MDPSQWIQCHHTQEFKIREGSIFLIAYRFGLLESFQVFWQLAVRGAGSHNYFINVTRSPTDFPCRQDAFVPEIIKTATLQQQGSRKTLLANQCWEMHPLYRSQIFAPRPAQYFFFLNRLSYADSSIVLIDLLGTHFAKHNFFKRKKKAFWTFFFHCTICWRQYLHIWWPKCTAQKQHFCLPLPVSSASSPRLNFSILFPLLSVFRCWNVYNSTSMNCSWHYLSKELDYNTWIWVSEWLCVNKCKGRRGRKKISTEGSKCLTKCHKGLYLYVVRRAGHND